MHNRYKEISSGIYCIVNLVNGMMYVGSAINLRKRETEHLLALNKGIHPNRYLQFAWNKYWNVSFKFKILQICEIDELLVLEQAWIDWINTVVPNGYNIRPLAANNLGKLHSEETKLKISEAKKGTQLSLETKLKMSETRKGRKQTEEWIAKRANANRGKIKTQEQIDNHRAAIRNTDKWPHSQGWKCKCEECKAKTNEMKRLTAANRRSNK